MRLVLSGLAGGATAIVGIFVISQIVDSDNPKEVLSDFRSDPEPYIAVAALGVACGVTGGLV